MQKILLLLGAIIVILGIFWSKVSRLPLKTSTGYQYQAWNTQVYYP